MVVPEIICIKVSTRTDGWLREAYFGQLLHAHPRAIRVFDAFPLLRPSRGGTVVVYCLALEYARFGDLMGMLVKGDARARIPTQEVRNLSCSNHLREIVHQQEERIGGRYFCSGWS